MQMQMEKTKVKEEETPYDFAKMIQKMEGDCDSDGPEKLPINLGGDDDRTPCLQAHHLKMPYTTWRLQAMRYCQRKTDECIGKTIFRHVLVHSEVPDLSFTTEALDALQSSTEA
eukprot:GEZU01009189.1.p1 GENE.GEZU01009189.1~~GEZU01009189.1.p1  ORF type:complete len:114 (+),score=20.51 GEZU01009189.1:732-1073(+)